MHNTNIQADIDGLLRMTELKGSFTISQIFSGGNNQLFEIDGDSWRSVLKIYFRDPLDTRDRFNTEKMFYDLLWTNGERAVPKLLAADKKAGATIFSFIEGEHLLDVQIGTNEIDVALNFLFRINDLRGTELAKLLPKVSEGAFSIVEHVMIVEGRVTTIIKELGENLSFVAERLWPVWEQIKRRALSMPDLRLDQSELILSPSDFGFHNVLQKSNGNFIFFDFEYAGWDDPSKTICDFFCQPKISVSSEYFEYFAIKLTNRIFGKNKSRDFVKRSALLFPVYQIKWVCILLASLQIGGKKRRIFAGEASDANAVLAGVEKIFRQIEKGL